MRVSAARVSVCVSARASVCVSVRASKCSSAGVQVSDLGRE